MTYTQETAACKLLCEDKNVAHLSYLGRSRKGNPLTARESSNLADDVFDRLTPGPPSPTPSLHRRSESDPNRGTPNLMELAASCEPYLYGQKRGRYYEVYTKPKC